MREVIEFSSYLLDALAQLFMQPPFLWFWGIILMLVVFKIFKSFAHF